MLPRALSLLGDNAGDPKFSRLEDDVFLQELAGAGHQCAGLLETARLGEQEALQRARLGLSQGAQSEIRRDALLMLRQGLLPPLVQAQQRAIDLELDAREGGQLFDDFKRLLLREAVKETNEGELVGEAQPVVRATALPRSGSPRPRRCARTRGSRSRRSAGRSAWAVRPSTST